MPSTDWEKHIFKQISMPDTLWGSTVFEYSCRTACFFSTRPCTLVAHDADARMCYLGDRDVHNELSLSLGKSMPLFESKGLVVWP